MSRGLPRPKLEHRPNGRVLAYLERIAQRKGDEALWMWLYFRDTKGRWQPRYVEDIKTGKIVTVLNDGGGLPKNTRRLPDQRALFHLLDRLTAKGLLPCSS